MKASTRRVLFLGPASSPVYLFLESLESQVIRRDEPLGDDLAFLEGVEFAVSHGYRHFIRNNVLTRLPDRVINLHISYLPWNRGADPNLWSFIDHTPKGATIHYVDSGLDTGDIIVQEEVVFTSPDETLASSYGKLQNLLLDLFKRNWDDIIAGRAPRFPQPTGGSYHKLSHRSQVEHLLEQGWDTPVTKLGS